MKKILSILLVAAMLASLVLAIIPAVAIETAPTPTVDPETVGNTVVNSTNRSAYVESLRAQGYKPLNMVTVSAGLEDNGKYYLTGDLSIIAPDDNPQYYMNKHKSNAEKGDPLKIGENNSKTAIENVTIDGCGYSLTLNAPLFVYSANVAIKNLTFKGTIDSDFVSPKGGCFSVITLWSHWGYCNFENVTCEAAIKTSNRTLTVAKDGEDRANGAQKLTALAIDAKDSTFKNVKVVADHTANAIADNLVAVGGFAGVTTGTATFEDCIITGTTTINATNLRNTNGYGGFVGHAKGNVIFKNCYNDRDLVFAATSGIAGTGYIGGFVGKADGNVTIEDCVYTGDVNVGGKIQNGDSAVGGFAGLVGGELTVKDCFMDGNVRFAAKTDFKGTFKEKEMTLYRQGLIGGVVGDCTKAATIENVVINGAVKLGSTTTALGGVAGILRGNNSKIANCVNNGSFTFESGANFGEDYDHGMGIGGIVGMSRCKNVVFEGCENYADIAFAANACIGYAAIGGIFGYQYQTNCETLDFINCYNAGDITESGNYKCYMGGIAGGIRGVLSVAVIDCKNDGNIKVTKGGSGCATSGGVIGVYGDCGNWMANNKALPTRLDVYSCVNNGEVLGGGHTGGILGGTNEIDHIYNTMTFFSCQNNGSVASFGNAGRAAGVLGDSAAKGDLSIYKCVNAGAVTGNSAGGVLSNAIDSGRTFVNIAINNCKNTGAINAVNYAGGIAANINASNSVAVKDCFNSGSVTSTAAASESPIAGGILGYTAKTKAVVTGNVNSGTVSCAVNNSESAVIYEKVILDADCTNYYLTGCVSGGTTGHATGKSQSEINSLVNAMSFASASNPYYINRSIAAVKLLTATDYTTDSWNIVAAALAAAEAKSNDSNANQAAVDSAKTTLDNAVKTLVIKALDLTAYNAAMAECNKLKKDDWSSNSWLSLTQAIEKANAMKNDATTLQSQFDVAVAEINTKREGLEVRKETDGQIDLEQMGQLGTNFTLRPVKPTGTEAPTDAPTEAPTAAPTEPIDEGGCGGIIGGAAIVLVAVGAIGMSISLKKKED